VWLYEHQSELELVANRKPALVILAVKDLCATEKRAKIF